MKLPVLSVRLWATVDGLPRVSDVPEFTTRSLKFVAPVIDCAPANDEAFVALKVVRFVPAAYPNTPGVFVRLPLKVTLILFEFKKLLALIIMFPFRTNGLSKSLTVAG